MIIKVERQKEGFELFSYPCLVEGSIEGFKYIVLAAKDGKARMYPSFVGVVLYSEYEGYSVGEYSDSWDKSVFKKFNGSILFKSVADQ